MTKNYAIIENEIVINIALSDEPLAENWIASEEAAIGWTYIDGQFSPPPEPTPTQEELDEEQAPLDVPDQAGFTNEVE